MTATVVTVHLNLTIFVFAAYVAKVSAMETAIKSYPTAIFELRLRGIQRKFATLAGEIARLRVEVVILSGSCSFGSFVAQNVVVFS